MSITQRFMQQAQPDWQHYVEHPFVQQLGNGTLPLASFQHYLIQDYHYLLHYSRALALAMYNLTALRNLLFLIKICSIFWQKCNYIFIIANNGKFLNLSWTIHQNHLLALLIPVICLIAVYKAV